MGTVMSDVEHLSDLLCSAQTGVAFTGAGISTESGIPDFRSPGGVWSRNTPVYYEDFMNNRDERVRYWKMREELYRDFKNAKPNDGHRALARLEQLDKIVAIVTQNIDGLHQDVGSSNVVELHGTSRIIACQQCGKDYQPDEIMLRIEAGEEAPECDECCGPLKSKTISFGQAMPEIEMRRAMELATQADVFVALGSSLVVEPAASVPRVAKQAGATLVIINKTETPLDAMADLVIREPIGETMRAVTSLVETR